MNLEKKLEQCKFNVKQIIHYNPDPYYVNYFLTELIRLIVELYGDILQEANREFGLFIDGKCTLRKFEFKAKNKGDQAAIKFFSWYNETFEIEHKTQYSNFIKNLIFCYEKSKQFPKIKIKIIANEKYQNDINQEIIVGLNHGRIRSKEELELQINRQMPIFLEMLNHKRKNQNEPKASVNQIIASAFMEFEKSKAFEIVDVCETYLSVLNRFIKESQKKINELKQW